MKKSFFCSLLIFLIINTLSAFIDDEDQKQGRILKKLDELKNIKGVLITGRGKAFFEAGFGSDNLFRDRTIVRDYNHILQMDVNFLAVPTPVFEIGGTLRLQNDLSGFWGLHGDSIVSRDLYAELILIKFVSLRVGQIYEKFTPFTLYAPVDALPLRSELLYSYYEDDLYENHLDHNNSFPLLGANIKADFTIKDIGSSSIKGIAAKIGVGSGSGKYSMSTNIYDRYLFGAHGEFKYKNILKANGTWMMLKDFGDTGIPSTRIYDTVFPIQLDIISGQAEVDAAPAYFSEKDPIKHLGVKAEIARSAYHHKKTVYTTNYSTNVINTNGMAGSYSAYISLENIKLEAGYRQVDYTFISPFAQTKTVISPGTGTSFDTAGLPPLAYEFSFINIPVLGKNYYDALNFTCPMNTATPNRKGLFFNFNLSAVIASIGGEYSSMQETLTIFSNNKLPRSFSHIEAYISFKPVFNFELTGFFINEENTRDDDSDTFSNEKEDLVINGMGAELVFRAVEKLSFIGAYQNYTLKGKKYIDVYNSNEPIAIKSYQYLDLNLINELVGVGFIYAFNKALTLQVDYLIKTYQNKYLSQTDYIIDTFRMLITAKF